MPIGPSSATVHFVCMGLEPWLAPTGSHRRAAVGGRCPPPEAAPCAAPRGLPPSPLATHAGRHATTSPPHEAPARSVRTSPAWPLGTDPRDPECEGGTNVCPGRTGHWTPLRPRARPAPADALPPVPSLEELARTGVRPAPSTGLLAGPSLRSGGCKIRGQAAHAAAGLGCR